MSSSCHDLDVQILFSTLLLSLVAVAHDDLCAQDQYAQSFGSLQNSNIITTQNVCAIVFERPPSVAY